MQERHQSRRGIAATRPSSVADTEDVLIRNHDFQWGYDLDVTIADADGRTVHDDRYYLQPGGTRSEFGLLEAGEYDVRVVLDGRRAATTSVEVRSDADGFLVELGNGAVSVHDGLYE